MSVKVIQVEMERWMYTIKSKDGREGTVFGSVVGHPGIMAVSMKPKGEGMFYCLKCSTVFSPKLNSCPECAIEDSQPSPECASTALDAPIS